VPEQTGPADRDRNSSTRFPVAVDAALRTAGWAVAAACPFPATELEGRQLHITYYDQPVDADRFAGIDAAAFLPEAFGLGDRALYLYAPDGLGRSKLADALSRTSVTKGLVATSRNWNTVEALVRMTAPPEAAHAGPAHDGAPA
ncbi:DUF1697 domain-containing protein, partial [Streptomyces sp. NPDC001948]